MKYDRLYSRNGSYKSEEREIQKVVAGAQAITSSIFGAVTVLVVLFIGPWSDANGRKFPILLSVSGVVSLTVMILIYHVFLRSAHISVLGLMWLVGLPMTLSGGAAVFAMSAYSYIADTTTPKNRTVRTGVLSAAVRSGTPMGFAIGGGMTKLGVGTLTSLIVALVMGLFALVIVVFRVKNTKPEICPIEARNSAKRSQRSAWIRYNPLIKLWESLAIVFKKRKEKHIFLILILAHICYAAPGSGKKAYIIHRDGN